MTNRSFKLEHACSFSASVEHYWIRRMADILIPSLL